MSADIQHTIAEASKGDITVSFEGESYNFDNQPRMGSDYEEYSVTVLKDTEDGDIEDVESDERMDRTDAAKYYNEMIQKYIPDLFEQEKLELIKCKVCGKEFYPILEREEDSGKDINCLETEEEEKTTYRTKCVTVKGTDKNVVENFESMIKDLESNAKSLELKEYYKKMLSFSKDLWMYE